MLLRRDRGRFGNRFRTHVSPVDFDPVQASLTRTFRAHCSPTVRHLAKGRPNAVLTFNVHEHEKICVFSLEWIRHNISDTEISAAESMVQISRSARRPLGSRVNVRCWHKVARPMQAEHRTVRLIAL